ncbi:MAG: efflux RND transporter periplasmic adaptor subunit [Burkholderiales bacterium]|nr:efflux RND transporter periplasmic adaptor subunit [Burkholderiales bacterium]
MKPLAALVTGIVLAGLGAAGGYWFAASRTQASASPAPAAEAAKAGGRRILYWYDPMVPQHRFDKPGKSPFMDMDLVPKYADEAEEGTVSVSPRVVQNLGVRTAEARTGTLARRLEAVGAVGWNERAVVVLQARTPGFVERLYVRAPLDAVAKGAPLVALHAPEWAAAQEEYLALLGSQAEGAAELRPAARERLLRLGMSAGDIAALERDRRVHASVTLTAPIAGVVAELGAREGMAVMPGATLFRIVDLASVWVNAEVPEAYASWVRPGAAVEARVPAWPGETFRGKVSAILPEVDPETRTVRARVELANPGARLKPGMFATLAFAPPAAKPAVLVPSEAVIRTGTRSVVLVAEGEGRFRPVDVEVGAEAGGETEILKGLSAGERVVVSGQFLVDSEASLRATGARLAGGVDAHRTAGRVERIAPDAVTISHDPVPALKWPAMTMDFLPPPGGWPAGARVGERIEFEFAPGAREGEWRVTRILPSAGAPRAGAASAPPAKAGPAPSTHVGEGVLVAGDRDSLIIRHGPLPSANMGAMTMEFAAPPAGLPRDVKPGDRIRFEFTMTPGGDFRATKVERLAGAAEAAR